MTILLPIYFFPFLFSPFSEKKMYKKKGEEEDDIYGCMYE